MYPDLNGKAIAVQGDMSKEETADLLVKAAVENFGRLDIFVNNAGMEVPAHTHEMTLDNWKKVIDVNLTGYFLGSRAALKHFLANGVKGSIINMSRLCTSKSLGCVLPIMRQVKVG